ncbi:MAG: hypothetical protein ACO3NZ_15660, partial [Pirellulales bacterium]
MHTPRLLGRHFADCEPSRRPLELSRKGLESPRAPRTVGAWTGRLARSLSGVVVALFSIISAAPLVAAPPDIVVFLSDDHTLRDCSVYGSPDIVTPNMERLAAAGMVFERAYVVSPSC